MSTSPPKILLVDDDTAIRLALSAKLTQSGYCISEAGTVAEALEFQAEAHDLALIDHKLPDGTGFELLGHLSDHDPSLPVIMISGYASVPRAVAAMNAGALDYVSKPVDLEDLRLIVESALVKSGLRRVTRSLRADQRRDSACAGIVGRSPELDKVRKLISRIAASPGSTVLVTGDSGTGKDLVARAIHAQSSRSGGPFVNITCSALPGALLESELFGHERGAFTDAGERKIGLLEHANGGTVFLDEIGETDLAVQAKLLRALESRTFRRVGGNVDIQTDVRFVAATNLDLRKAVTRRTFREDLYYRLAVLTVCLPPLCQRRGDAELLAMHFVDRFCREFGRHISGVSEEALALIRSYAWPGNVRELKNTIERAVLLSRSEVLTVSDFEMLGNADGADVAFKLPAAGVNLRDLERTLVEQALERTHGNRTRAARLLGMNRDQIRYRIGHSGVREGTHARKSGD